MCFVGGVRRFGYYANTAQTKAHGVELEGSADLGPLVDTMAGKGLVLDLEHRGQRYVALAPVVMKASFSGATET